MLQLRPRVGAAEAVARAISQCSQLTQSSRRNRDVGRGEAAWPALLDIAVVTTDNDQSQVKLTD